MPSGRFTNILRLRSSRSMLLGIKFRSRFPVFERPTCFISFFSHLKAIPFSLSYPPASRSFSSSFSKRRELTAWIFWDDEKLLVIAHRWRSRGMSPLTSPLFGGSGEGYTQTSVTTIMAACASSRWESFGLHLQSDPLVTWARNQRKALTYLSDGLVYRLVSCSVKLLSECT